MTKIIKKEEIPYPFLEKPLKLFTFENGFKVVFAYKDSPMINISSWVKTGSINENNENNGVSHFVEHLLFKGTTKFPAGVFDKTMERLGGIINAATWKDYTFFYINIPKEHSKIALEMHADMMVDAIFPIEEIGPEFDPNKKAPEQKRERYVVIEEIRMGEDNNWRKVYKNLNSIMYEKHPYKREVIGTKEIIASISRDEIFKYYKTFYTPQNITTIVTGDFDEENMIDLIQKNFIFKECPEISKCTPDFKIPEIKIKNPDTIVEYSDVQTGYIMLGALCDSAKNQKETITLDLISTILGDGKSSRLYSDLIENASNPHYYQLESCHYQFKDGDNFFIEANFDPAKKDIVIEELKKHLLDMQKISPEELNKAKKRFKVNFAQDSEMVSDISDTIGYYMTVCDDVSKAQKQLEILDEIDCDYLSEIVKKYLKPECVSISLILPSEGK